MIKIPLYKEKNIAVFGLGKAGLSTVRALQNSGANIFAWDDGAASREKLESEGLANVTLRPIEECEWSKGINELILSPGVPLTHPAPHPVVELAKKGGCPIICDVELLYRADREAKFIGITGTNGKSTTTALTGHILKHAGVKSTVGGNIGIPVLDLDTLGKGGTYVIEMSSYQLDLIDEMKFDISVLMNVTPDHLDRHGDMAGYIAAKKHIYDRQDKSCAAIISVDDEHCRKIFNELKSAGKIGQVIPISVNEKQNGGIAVIDGIIYDGLDNSEVALGALKRLPGKHNAQNIAAAYAATKISGVKADVISEAIRSFEGLPHRMQYVGEYSGVTYINDSKATNAEAAAKALVTFDNIYWIAGGLAKEGGIESLTEFFPKIKRAYLIGKAEEEFAGTLDGKVDYVRCGDLATAFKKAQKDANDARETKPVVLLSPACASFDQWPNFEVRGDAFIRECKSLRE